MARRILFILLAITLAAMLPGSGRVGTATAQQDQALPPTVIDVSPLPGVELLPSDVLTVYFDQAMDFASVEKAVAFTPTVNGTFDWADAQTLTFKPGTPWQVGKTYQVTIGKGAAARTGVTLDAPYEFKVKTLSPLAAANVAPAPNATDVETHAKIVVSFNHPVIALGADTTRAPFILTPSVDGQGEWVNTSLYVFTPSLPLATDSDYQVTIAAGLQSVDGATMDTAYSWTFHTLPPHVTDVSYQSIETFDTKNQAKAPDPKNVYPNSSFQITFSQAIWPANVEKNLTLVEISHENSPLPAHLIWSKDYTSVSVQPADSLKRDTDYRLRLALGKTDKPFDFNFHTLSLPTVVSTDPEDKGTTNISTGGYEGVYVTFSAPIDDSSIAGHIFIDSQPLRETASTEQDNPQTIIFPLSRTPGTTYTVKVTAGIKDIFGVPTTQDHTFSFTAVSTTSETPSVRPIINGDMMISSIYTGETQIPVSVPDDQTVDVGLYRWPPTSLGDVAFRNHQIYGAPTSYYGGSPEDREFPTRCKPHPAVNAANLIRKWSWSLKSDDGDVQNLLPAGSKKTLPPGLYWVTMGKEIECVVSREITTSTVEREKGPQYQFGFAVVSANITLKRGPESVFVFLSDLKTAKPVPNATVTVYGDGQALGSATTDSVGGATVPVHMLDHRFILITAAAPGVFGAWYNNWVSGGWRNWGGNGASDNYEFYYDLSDPTTGVGYLYTDRPIYRPGDTVHYRGVLRMKRDMQFPVPDQRSVDVSIDSSGDSDNQTSQYSGKTTLSDYGTFSGDFTIPKDAPLGDFGISASSSSDNNVAAYVGFTVAAYRAPEFEVSVKAAKDTIIQGDPLDTTVQVGYYSGGAVRQADVKWNTSYCKTTFDYQGSGFYSFGQDDWSGYGNFNSYYSRYYPDYYYDSCDYNVKSLDSDQSARTDDKGRAAIHTTNTTPKDFSGPVEITVEATATDTSGLEVSNRTTVLAHPATVYVGVGTTSFVGGVRQPITFNLITVTSDSRIKPNQRVPLRIEHYDWSHGYQKSGWVALDNANPIDVTTDASGKATYQFVAQHSGDYRLVATVIDDQGHANSASLSVWVTDPRTAAWYTRNDSDPLSILTDRQNYRPGDTASLLIPVPRAVPMTVLLTVERAGVITHDVLFSADGAPLLYKLPISESMSPDAYITATYISNTNLKSDGDSAVPSFQVSGVSQIHVTSKKQQLNITLKAAQNTLKPGATAKFDVWVTDSNGKPATAEVGLKLVDKSVLDILGDNAGQIGDAFYHEQPLETYTDVSIDGLFEYAFAHPARPPELGGGGGGGGGGGTGPSIRSNFQVTPLWSPQVITDANGHATVSVKLPDNVTTFQFDARAVTSGADLKSGRATLNIISTLPLIIRPETPRFLVVGDRVDLAAMVNNDTEQDQDVTVSVQATGVKLDGGSDQHVTILAGGRQRVTWRGTVQDVPDADLVFTAIGQNGAQDAAKPSLATGPNGTLPVYRFTTSETLAATSGILRTAGTKTEGVTLPPRLAQSVGTAGTQGQLQIRVDPSLASTLNGSFTYLQQYPYFCIEQTVSRFLPNVATYHALRQLYQNNPKLEADLKVQLKAATDKLANEQKANGSWGWYPDTPTDPLTSAYAVLGLIEAQNAGFPVDSTMLTRALAYVQSQVVSPLGVNGWQLNRQAFYLYVLARGGKVDQAELEAIYGQREGLSLAARAYLLMAFQEQFPTNDAIKTLTSDLLSKAQFSATGTHWEESDIDWYNWGTDTRTTALVLTALLRSAPQSDLLPNVVRWLMAARQEDHWYTTQETVWSIVALSEWMITTDELHSSYRYDVRFNGSSAASGSIKPSALSGQTVKVDVNNLLKGTLNRVSISRGDGTGALYYTAQFSAQTDASQVKAASRGISIKREYFAADDLRTPISSANLGDVITVRLTITTTQEVQYFTLEDMFPAGTEAIDSSLLTTSSKINGPTINGVSTNDPYWYWGWWYFDHIELRDAETNLNATFLPSGTYIYTYQLRAATTGVFQVMPTRAYTFYSSDVFGRSDGSVFTINAPDK